MSTTFVIFKPDIHPSTNEDGGIDSEQVDDYNCAEIAFRSGNSISLLGISEVLIWYIPDHVKVYPIDNTPQGIFSVGDIKKQILERKQHGRNF